MATEYILHILRIYLCIVKRVQILYYSTIIRDDAMIKCNVNIYFESVLFLLTIYRDITLIPIPTAYY